MKKSLVALAILGAVSAPAFSQMVIFGKIDQSVGKPLGTTDKQVMDNAGSRIAFRGYEDLGGGMGALFMMEHRFAPDTGAAATATTFWDGFSLVGLRTPFGTVTAGRQYTSSFLDVQNQVDPFAGEGVGQLRNIGAGISLTGLALPGAINTAGVVTTVPTNLVLGPAKVRVANSVKYANRFGPVSVSFDIAENNTVPSTALSPDKPYSLAVAYLGGPLWAGVAYENANGRDDNLLNFAARYTMGALTLSGMYSLGEVNQPLPAAFAGGIPQGTVIEGTAFLLGVKYKVGSGDIKAGYASLKGEVVGGASTTVSQRLGLGYDHHLSKRTKVYAQYGREGKLATNKTAYEVGMQHNF